jgi:hypothetical protein
VSDSAASNRSNPLVIVALVIAIAALAVAIWSFVSAPSSGDTSTASTSTGQSGDPKAEVCNAFTLVRNAVSLQTNANLGPDPVATQAVAANARLATLGGGQFLLSRLEGDLPADLADAVRSFANNLEYIGMGQLAGAPGDDANQISRMNDAQATSNKITELCK